MLEQPPPRRIVNPVPTDYRSLAYDKVIESATEEVLVEYWLALYAKRSRLFSKKLFWVKVAEERIGWFRNPTREAAIRGLWIQQITHSKKPFKQVR